jgi:Protein of unknown function (DUF1553)/Protein of unknown function (DUF1549)/Concanavalin A-like lectin/glucanases superfamily/Planctomycete cytochrome C
VKTSASLLLFVTIAVACASAAGDAASPGAKEPAVDFARDVRPILADRCFACHGPDERARKAGLRLDLAEGAVAETESGARAVVPFDVDASELVRRVFAHDDDEVMPPPEHKRPLSDAEKATLRAWVAGGGEYAPHWAFVAPTAGNAPAVRDAAWVVDPLDAHVLAALESRGIAPSPRAEPMELLRRASLALTGLPPSPEDADGFAKDPTQQEYERRIAAMLDSDAAAEHMATAWLDLARYADTYGYQTDGEMRAWPWRDWLLRALRADMPFDQFVTRIVAGDLLPDATVDDRVATAFHRLHRMTEEGGSIAEEFRQEGIADRVATFGSAFLGLTLECARCHDHKYDPISQREFYGLAAMFGSIDENGLKSYSLHVDAQPPFVRLQSPEQLARTRELEAEVAQREREHAAARQSAISRAATVRMSNDAFDPPPPDVRYPFDVLENGASPNAVSEGKPATTDRRRPEQLGEIALGDGVDGKAMQFDGDGGVLLDGVGGFGRHDEISLAMWLRPGERNARAALVHASGFYTQDADASGIELSLDDGRVRWSAIRMWPGSAASVRAKAPLPVGKWTHLVVSYDGSSRAAGLSIRIDGEIADVEIVRDALDGPLATHALEVGSRSRDSGFRSGAIDELRVWRRALTAAQSHELARLDGVRAAAPLEAGAIESHQADAMDDEVAKARNAWRDAQRKLAAHLDAIPSLPCMADSAFACPTYVLRRGAYDQPDLAQPSEPGALASVLPFDAALPKNRLGLARWLVDPDNPLVARVAVNRLWAQLFGRGLVETQENFGLQGTMPSNMALLDLLARDFANGDGADGSRWSMRRMLFRIATSATFAQSSVATEAARVADPHNERLSRGPSFRLSAEALRDQALAASGLLAPRFCGPSVKPVQPEGLWAEAGQGGGYATSAGDDAHRRSLYTFRKRTVPAPSLATFDAPSREACVARRLSTNTPLQFLALANDPAYVECARALAQRVEQERATRGERIVRTFRLVCVRLPTDGELRALEDLVASVAARSASEHEALALACQAILCSDAAVTVR